MGEQATQLQHNEEWMQLDRSNFRYQLYKYVYVHECACSYVVHNSRGQDHLSALEINAGWTHTRTTKPVITHSRPDFLRRSSCISVDLLSYDSKPTEKREQWDWRAEKNWTGLSLVFSFVEKNARQARHIRRKISENLERSMQIFFSLLLWQTFIDTSNMEEKAISNLCHFLDQFLSFASRRCLENDAIKS